MLNGRHLLCPASTRRRAPKLLPPAQWQALYSRESVAKLHQAASVKKRKHTQSGAKTTAFVQNNIRETTAGKNLSKPSAGQHEGPLGRTKFLFILSLAPWHALGFGRTSCPFFSRKEFWTKAVIISSAFVCVCVRACACLRFLQTLLGKRSPRRKQLYSNTTNARSHSGALVVCCNNAPNNAPREQLQITNSLGSTTRAV